MNSKITWEWGDVPINATYTYQRNHPDVDLIKWVHDQEKIKKTSPPEPSEQEMIEKILTGIDDEGFFRDILDWLKKMAPKKVPRFLEELYIPINSGLTCSYDGLCEIVYKLGFKASETLEHRMILGANNKWVQEYFKDFYPP